MLMAQQMEMTHGDYVFIHLILSYTEAFPFNEGFTADKHDFELYKSVLFVEPFRNVTQDYKSFMKRYLLHSLKKHDMEIDAKDVSDYVLNFYDTILYMGLISQRMKVLKVVTLCTWMRQNSYFNALQRNFYMDRFGHRKHKYIIKNLNFSTKVYQNIYEITWSNFYQKLKIVKNDSIDIAWLQKFPPPNHPICGFNNQHCQPKELANYEVIILMLAFLLILLASVNGIMLISGKLKEEAFLSKKTWSVNKHDVVFSSIAHDDYLLDLGQQEVDIVNPLPFSYIINLPRKKFLLRTFFGKYKERDAILKQFLSREGVLSHNDLFEIRQLQLAKHENLISFYGGISQHRLLLLIFEYGQKGSLQQLIESTTTKFDNLFKVALIQDLIEGMIYIHQSSIYSHGRLSSSNCVLDNSMVLKVTEFGLPTFYSKVHSTRKDDAYYKKMFWKAPELLRLTTQPIHCTQEADIYSFAIILWEINQLQFPYSDYESSPKEIINSIKENLFTRPKVDERLFNSTILNILNNCWAENLKDRPDFLNIKTQLQLSSIDSDTTVEAAIDSLLQRKEEYATILNQEIEVNEKKIILKKQECSSYFMHLFPKEIGLNLQDCFDVEPREYKNLTVLRAEIYNFNTLTADLELEVVFDILNDIDEIFDNIISEYDVYQIETIGDAYTAVSGLQERSGINHAAQIAQMAFHIRQAVLNFKIKHLPEEALKIRIGLHSGPCMAGVVGLTVPRYCVFGQTVTIAKEMASSGEAGRIHVSPYTKLILDQFEGYILEERGMIEIKGIGNITTYWLTGIQNISQSTLEEQMP